MKIVVEIEPDGNRCGRCRGKYQAEPYWNTPYKCMVFGEILMKQNGKLVRLPKCLDAEVKE